VVSRVTLDIWGVKLPKTEAEALSPPPTRGKVQLNELLARG